MPLPAALKDEKNERYVPYYWGWVQWPFPCPCHPSHCAFSVMLFILWHTGVEGGGSGEGESGWLAIAIKLLPLLPLVTKWEITHVMGHGAGNPKPVPRVRVFWGYRISNPYLYPRETHGKTHDIPYLLRVELTLVSAGVEAIFSESSEHFFNMLPVVYEIVEVNENIV